MENYLGARSPLFPPLPTPPPPPGISRLPEAEAALPKAGLRLQGEDEFLRQMQIISPLMQRNFRQIRKPPRESPHSLGRDVRHDR